MILYHGTTEKAAVQIAKDGLLKATTPEIARYIGIGIRDTTCGYVYAADNVNIAMGYAIEVCSGNYSDAPRAYYLFKIAISDDEVETDKDNERLPAIASTLYQDDGHCYQVGRDLILGKDVVAYISFRVNGYQEACNKLVDNPKLAQYCDLHWKAISATDSTNA